MSLFSFEKNILIIIASLASALAYAGSNELTSDGTYHIAFPAKDAHPAMKKLQSWTRAGTFGLTCDPVTAGFACGAAVGGAVGVVAGAVQGNATASFEYCTPLSQAVTYISENGPVVVGSLLKTCSGKHQGDSKYTLNPSFVQKFLPSIFRDGTTSYETSESWREYTGGVRTVPTLGRLPDKLNTELHSFIRQHTLSLSYETPHPVEVKPPMAERLRHIAGVGSGGGLLGAAGGGLVGGAVGYAAEQIASRWDSAEQDKLGRQHAREACLANGWEDVDWETFNRSPGSNSKNYNLKIITTDDFKNGKVFIDGEKVTLENALWFSPDAETEIRIQDAEENLRLKKDQVESKKSHHLDLTALDSYTEKEAAIKRMKEEAAEAAILRLSGLKYTYSFIKCVGDPNEIDARKMAYALTHLGRRDVVDELLGRNGLMNVLSQATFLRIMGQPEYFPPFSQPSDSVAIDILSESDPHRDAAPATLTRRKVRVTSQSSNTVRLLGERAFSFFRGRREGPEVSDRNRRSHPNTAHWDALNEDEDESVPLVSIAVGAQ